MILPRTEGYLEIFSIFGSYNPEEAAKIKIYARGLSLSSL